MNGLKPEHWVRTFFPTYASDKICNNLSKSFNAHILETNQPIITMMESNKVSLMKRIVN